MTNFFWNMFILFSLRKPALLLKITDLVLYIWKRGGKEKWNGVWNLNFGVTCIIATHVFVVSCEEDRSIILEDSFTHQSPTKASLPMTLMEMVGMFGGMVQLCVCWCITRSGHHQISLLLLPFQTKRSSGGWHNVRQNCVNSIWCPATGNWGI